MNNKKTFHKASNSGFALGAMLMAALTGCVARIDGPRVVVREPVVRVEPVFVVQDDYIYYPGYDVYYSSHRHQYAYLEGGVWISRPRPRGVSVDILLASPSVRMDFHDSPAHHHAEIVRQYPRNWAPARANQGRKEERQDDKRDERRDK